MNADPSWRKPAGVLGILVYLAFWVVLVASFSAVISGLWWPVQAIIYLVAGIIWIVPLGPALMWMETGRWRR